MSDQTYEQFNRAIDRIEATAKDLEAKVDRLELREAKRDEQVTNLANAVAGLTTAVYRIGGSVFAVAVTFAISDRIFGA